MCLQQGHILSPSLKDHNMQFHQYKTFWTTETRCDYLLRIEESQNVKDVEDPLVNHAVSEKAWVGDRRPFYRFWPGLFYAMSKVDLSQIRLRHLQFTLPDDLRTIVVEFPKGVPYETYGISAKYIEDGEEVQASSLNSLLVYQSTFQIAYKDTGRIRFKDSGQSVYVCVLCEEDAKGLRCQRTGIVFHDQEMDMTVPEYLESRMSLTENQRGYLSFICRILVIIALLSNDDHGIFERIILARDKGRFDPDSPEKFWERAKNNGMYGWDVGKNLPTPEELEEYKANGTFRGKNVPHFRNGSFAIRWTGKGRTIAKVVWIRETVVNKHLATRLPEGYYGNEEAAGVI